MRKLQFTKDNIYHIYNRGVEKRDVFMNDNDRWRFLQGLFLFNDTKSSSNLLWELERENGRVNFKILKEYFSKNNNTPREPLIRILADCLMPNHYHLLVEPLQEGGITKFMHKLGTGYTMYFNKKYKRVGGLFQDTFKAVHVDEDNYLQHLLVYINVMNPGQLIEPNLKEEGVKDREKVMKFAEDYLWSTHKEYLQTRDSIIIDKGLLGNMFLNGQEYREFVYDILPEKSKFDDITHLILEK